MGILKEKTEESKNPYNNLKGDKDLLLAARQQNYYL